jgi:hypothetical protein
MTLDAAAGRVAQQTVAVQSIAKQILVAFSVCGMRAT